MASANVETIGRLYEAINRVGNDGRADRPTTQVLADLFDPDVEVRQMEGIAGTAGTFRGYEGLRQSQAELNEHVVDIRFEPERYFEEGDTVVVDVRAYATGRESGARSSARIGHLWELRDGRVVRWVVYAEPDGALEAAGLPPSGEQDR